ncbi:hypothetical protein HJFPF1_07060 [Paramyrothecium foliicola]|nr:hypothetical protein HJFPF1_07060 [Paramyrothecium foliicola]
MAVRAESAGLSMLGSDDDDDDLMILHAEPAMNRRTQPPQNDFDSLLLPRPHLMASQIRSVTPSQREAPRRAERERMRQRTQYQTILPGISSFTTPDIHRPRPQVGPTPLVLPGQQQQQQQAPQETAVIDLTEEPDSPVQTRAQLPPQPRNPRRTNSQRGSAPALVRSDGSAVPTFVTHIDLTDDSPEDDRPQETHSRRLRSQPSRTGTHANRFNGRDQLFSWDFAGFAGFGRQLADYLGMELPVPVSRTGFSRPQLNVSLTAFEPPRTSAEEPKPPMEPVAAPRQGFTRDTCASPEEGSLESVVICPACKEELAYDPADTVSHGPSVTAGKKRKRAPGEHHFWALKKCGHVYCADCFENRKPTKASPNGVGFRLLNGAQPGTAPNEVRCAVDDCETKVAQKTEWVGIFL